MLFLSSDFFEIYLIVDLIKRHIAKKIGRSAPNLPYVHFLVPTG
jgi:hypothetical protein